MRDATSQQLEDAHRLEDLRQLDEWAASIDPYGQPRRKGLPPGADPYNDQASRRPYVAEPGRAKFHEVFAHAEGPELGILQGRSRFETFEDFAHAVERRDFSRLLGAGGDFRNANVGDIPSDAGFLVPDGFTSEIFDIALETEIVRPRARVYPMRTNNALIPAWDTESTHAGGAGELLLPPWRRSGSVGHGASERAPSRFAPCAGANPTRAELNAGARQRSTFGRRSRQRVSEVHGCCAGTERR